jgi:hypothetical protein
MDKDDLIKLTEALGALGYKIKDFHYINTENQYHQIVERVLELTLSLPKE